jgi:hypothetical protein
MTAIDQEELLTDAASVMERTGMTYRQLDHWVRQDYLRPVDANAGSGVARAWSESELQVASLMRRLVAVGFLPMAAAEHARALQALGPPALLVLAGGITLEVS